MCCENKDFDQMTLSELEDAFLYHNVEMAKEQAEDVVGAETTRAFIVGVEYLRRRGFTQESTSSGTTRDVREWLNELTTQERVLRGIDLI